MEPFTDAIALIRANQQHNARAVEHVLASADLREVALVLAQMVQTGVRTQGMTVEDFLDMQIDKIIERGDAPSRATEGEP